MAKKKLDPIVKEVVAEMERQGLVAIRSKAPPQRPRDTSGLSPIVKSLVEEVERQQLSVYAVAKRAGVTSAVAGRILNGERPDPQLSSVVALAYALGFELALKKAEE